MLKYKCTFPNCNRSFESHKGLVFHQQRDYRHNPNQSFIKFDGGNKRHSIPYESSKIAESSREKKL